MPSDLDPIFKPKSIAVIGVSRNPNKIGSILFKYLTESGLPLYPINPHLEEFMGYKAYPSVLEVPEEIDLAIISVPAKAVPQVLEDCVKKGVKGVVIISSGFGETGPEGKKLEEKLKEIIKKGKTRVLGPNTLGIYIPSRKIDGIFTLRERSPRPPAGMFAYISQSGAAGVAFMDYAAHYGIGISAFVGLGNKIDVTEAELMEYFAEDEETKAIALYLESIKDGKRFLEVAKRVTKKKPVVVLKGGRTKRGAVAAALHTGSLAGSDAVIEGAFKQAGIIRAYDEEEIIDFTKVLAYSKPMFGPNVAIVTSGGGYGVIATDYIESTPEKKGVGLKMAELTEETKQKLREILVPYASVKNPIDMTADVTDEQYDKTLEIVNEDPNVDGILCLALFQTPFVSEKLVDIVEKWCKHGKKPMVVVSIGGTYTQKMIKEMEQRHVPIYPSIWRGAKALRVLYDRGRYLKKVGAEGE